MLGIQPNTMPVTCRVFIATSLDGYISRADGTIDWLDQANQIVPSGEDCGYGAFMASVDAIIMGRATFETVKSMSSWPYAETPVYVLSHSLSALPADTPQMVRLLEPVFTDSSLGYYGL